jgi:hypothetical protein
MNRHRWLLAILLLAVLLRVGVALYLGDTTPPAKDETSYSTLAYRLATGHGYSFPVAWYPFAPADAATSHWSFLYTAFAAAVYSVTGFHPLAVRLVQAVACGLLMPWLTWRLARRALPAQPAAHFTIRNSQFTIHNFPAIIAALLAATYAYFILYGAMVQTEAFFICALLWSLERSLTLSATWAHDHNSQFTIHNSQFRIPHSAFPWFPALTLGLSLGVATLLRQSILPWVPVLFVWLLAVAWIGSGARGEGRGAAVGRALLALTVAGLVLIACILPFTVRNYRVYGDFLLLNSNAGYAMYSAQHPLHGTDFQAYAAAPLPADLTPTPQNEAQWDRALMARGIQFVLAEPGRYLLLSLSRVQDYLEFWPKDSSSFLFNLGRMLSFALLLPFMFYGAGLALRDEVHRARQEGWAGFWASGAVFLLLFVLFYSVLHIFSWAMPRYRLPADAVLLIYAAQGLATLRACPRITSFAEPRP